MSLINVKDKLLINLINRERNHCNDDQHSMIGTNNCSDLIDWNDNSDDQKPIKIENLKKFDRNCRLTVVEFGGLKLTNQIIKEIFEYFDCNSLQCLRIYDCQGIDDESLSFIGGKCGKTLRHLELIGGSMNISELGMKQFIDSIGNLEVIHYDAIIKLLIKDLNNKIITNLSSIWTKVDEKVVALDVWEKFCENYSRYLRSFDITFTNTRQLTRDYFKQMKRFDALTRLSLTSTNEETFEDEFDEMCNTNLTKTLSELNICVWKGNSEKLLKSIGKLTNLQTLTINGRSPIDRLSFDFTTNLSQLKSLQKLRHLRLILKNHAKNVFESIGDFLPNLEIVEFVGQSLTDESMRHLSRLSRLTFIDVCSAQITDNGVNDLISNMSKSSQLSYIRINSSKITSKSISIISEYSRNHLNDLPSIDFVINSRTEFNPSMVTQCPNNLNVQVKDSAFLLNFPGSTPRGF